MIKAERISSAFIFARGFFRWYWVLASRVRAEIAQAKGAEPAYSVVVVNESVLGR